MKTNSHHTATNKDQIVHFQDILNPDLVVGGVGVDIMDVNRMRRQLAGQPDLADQIFTIKEIAYCRSCPDPAVRFAQGFATKEAFLKALGAGWQYGISFREVELSIVAGGRPRLKLSGRAAQLAAARSIETIHVSLSNTDKLALAAVILEIGSKRGTE